MTNKIVQKEKELFDLLLKDGLIRKYEHDEWMYQYKQLIEEENSRRVRNEVIDRACKELDDFYEGSDEQDYIVSILKELKNK